MMPEACYSHDETEGVLIARQKKQKTFSIGTDAKRLKVFWFFFSKKNVLALPSSPRERP